MLLCVKNMNMQKEWNKKKKDYENWSGLNYKAILTLVTFPGFINIHVSCNNSLRISEYRANSQINSHVIFSMSCCLDLKQPKKSLKTPVLKRAPNAVLLKTCCLFPFWGWVASFSKHSLLLHCFLHWRTQYWNFIIFVHAC